ncbi:hypothetical protein [Acidovorax carolinensis]|jgi:hypothetical protein|nr:hypothetical protein [Acidovorax carolinensis]
MQGIIVLSIIGTLITVAALWVATNDSKASNTEDDSQHHAV